MPTPQLFGNDSDGSSAGGDDTKKTPPTEEDNAPSSKEDVAAADTNKEDGDTDMKDVKETIGDDDDDDDDDDSDSGNKATEKPSTEENPEKKKAEDPFDSDSSSDDVKKAAKPAAAAADDDEKEGGDKDEAAKEPEKDPFDSDDSDDEVSPKKKTKKKSDNDDDDNLLEDSDDGDAEFDDAGGITGTGHTKGFQRKVSVQKSSLDKAREAEERAMQKIDEEAEEAAPVKPKAPKVDPRTMVVATPDLPPSSATMHITKLPNLVGIQPEAFDAATYSAAREEKDFNGFVHDMIRWRYKTDKDGEMVRDDETNQLIRESNARIVQWEDDSYTLHVGKETFEVNNINSSQSITAPDDSGRKFSFAGLNGFLYLSQIATYRVPKEDEDKNDDADGADKAKDKVMEYDETPAGTVLECMGAIGSRFTARPLLKSEAHKSLTVAVRQKNIKRAMIAEVVTQEDPELAKENRIKLKDGLEKEAARKRSYGDGYRGRSRTASRPRPGMNRGYLEDDDGDFDDIGINAMKKRTMNADDDDMMDDYGDDDSDSEEEATFNRRPARKSNALGDSDDDSDDAPGGAKKGAKPAANDDDDDDDDEVLTPVKTSKKRTHQAFDDDDSDD